MGRLPRLEQPGDQSTMLGRGRDAFDVVADGPKEYSMYFERPAAARADVARPRSGVVD
jgi:hypothetical protein